MRNGITVTVLFACLIGSALLFYAGWELIIVGLLCVLFAFLYTTGPYPLSYNGWGDVLVIVFFGFVPVGVTYYVQALTWTSDTTVASLICGLEAEERGQGEAIARNIYEMSGLKVPVVSIIIGEGGSGGALAMATADEVWMLENSIYSILSPEGFASILWKDSLVVNNYRDREADARSGKRTVIVRFGEKFGRYLYLMLGVTASLLCFWFFFEGHLFAALLPLLYLIPHVLTWRRMVQTHSGKKLNSILGETSRNMLLMGILLSIGFLIRH